MDIADFDYNLPEELIAHFPKKERSDSRLLALLGQEGRIEHRRFKDICDYLEPGDLLVFNNTKVIPARVFGQKESGAKLEILVERILDEVTCLAHVKCNRSPKVGATLRLDGEGRVAVEARQDGLFKLKLAQGSWLDFLDHNGHIPLPPYIERADEEVDQDRYQTVYAKEPGAVAATTAGLHFDESLLEKLTAKGIEFAYVTLHVGAGTFQPVRVDRVEAHKMHAERVKVSADVCEQVAACKARGNKVIAVGTTCVRSLESAAQSGQLEPFEGETDIYIYPGYEFKVIDSLITNFHLPRSTLLLLVSAFCNKEAILRAYNEAISERYRFFSYGDAMFIAPNDGQD